MTEVEGAEGSGWAASAAKGLRPEIEAVGCRTGPRPGRRKSWMDRRVQLWTHLTETDKKHTITSVMNTGLVYFSIGCTDSDWFWRSLLTENFPCDKTKFDFVQIIMKSWRFELSGFILSFVRSCGRRITVALKSLISQRVGGEKKHTTHHKESSAPLFSGKKNLSVSSFNVPSDWFCIFLLIWGFAVLWLRRKLHSIQSFCRIGNKRSCSVLWLSDGASILFVWLSRILNPLRCSVL